MPTSPLPTPTALLTALFNSLPPLPPTAPLPSNPLVSAPPSTKSLFLTLHALFPNEFLPALELLDRGLVTRVVIGPVADKQEREQAQASVLLGCGAEAACRTTKEGDGAAAHESGLTDADADEEEDGGSVENGRPAMAKEKGKENSTTEPDSTTAKGRAHNAVYYVHSAAASAQRPGRSRYAGIGEKSYEVRLRAWNCSCPAFTFSAFGSTPRVSVASFGRRAPVEVDVDVDESMETADGGGVEDGWGGEGGMEEGERSEEWVFGALSSLWAAGGETVPVCKHLLACVVGERCGLLGGLVVERVVGRGEGAGLGAGWGG